VSAAGDALAVLSRWRAPDDRQERLRREYVALLHRRPDATDRTCAPDHLTASTLLVSADHTRCLLTLHAKAGRWFQLGGHCEPTDATLAAAARREAEEESGLTALRVDPVPLQLDAHAVPFCSDPGTRHLDVRFLAVAPEDARTRPGAESADLRWWPLDRLPTNERSVVDLVRLAQERLAAG
jgi:8-oxo-dGTP pyrophosphatase MutT (NUDIX family)